MQAGFRCRALLSLMCLRLVLSLLRGEGGVGFGSSFVFFFQSFSGFSEQVSHGSLANRVRTVVSAWMFCGAGKS